MKSYVLGFLFDLGLGRVVLIRKNRPAWQAGRMNGLGGHIEAGEPPEFAMRREFREESGLDIYLWTPFGRLHGKDWEVHLYWARSDFLPSNLCEEGEVLPVQVSSLDSQPIMDNLRYLIPMAQNHILKKDACRFFDICEDPTP